MQNNGAGKDKKEGRNTSNPAEVWHFFCAHSGVKFETEICTRLLC